MLKVLLEAWTRWGESSPHISPAPMPHSPQKGPARVWGYRNQNQMVGKGPAVCKDRAGSMACSMELWSPGPNARRRWVETQGNWFGFKWRNNLNFFFLVIWHGMWDLSSLTRDQTWMPWTGSMECPNHWTTRKFQQLELYLFMAVLGLCCSQDFISSCDKQGTHSSCGARASHCSGFSCCGAQVPEWAGFRSCSMWDLPRPGTESLSPALAGGFFTTEPAEKPPTT